MKVNRKFFAAALGVALLMSAITAAVLFLSAQPVAAQAAATASADPEVVGWAFISAALAAGLSVLAAGYAVGSIGSAAVGALAEKPELFGRLLILIGLAEGLAIYGLIVAVLIFNRVA